MPLLLTYCKETYTPINDVWNENIRVVLFILSYVIERNKEEERMYKQIRNSKIK